MSWIFSKELMALNGRQKNMEAQFAVVNQRRQYHNTVERGFAHQQGLHTNAAALIPTEVFREIDNVTKLVMRPDSEFTMLNDLLPLAKSLPIGKIEHQHRRASDSGSAITTISGAVPNTLDKTQYSFEKSIIPIHSDAFGREWRELEGQRSEGFDGLIDDAENATHEVRDKMVKYIFDGDASAVFNGTVWTGIRNDSRVAAIDLGAGGLNVDFTSSSLTGATARDKFIQIRNTLRITNNASGNLTVWVSREILSNLERWYTDNDKGFGTILADLKSLSGIADIKEDSELSGNEIVLAVLNSRFIRPLVGMAVNTVPLIRNNPFDNFNFLVWGAMGLEILTDFDGKTGVAYATG